MPVKGGDFLNKPSIVWHCGFTFRARFLNFFVVGIEAKTEVHAKNWTSRMIFTIDGTLIKDPPFCIIRLEKIGLQRIRNIGTPDRYSYISKFDMCMLIVSC